MALENILNKIREDSKRKAESFVASQQEKADEILANAQAKADQIKCNENDKMVRRLDSIKDADSILNKLEIRKIKLEEKRRILEEIYNKSLEKILKLPKTEYKKIVISQLNSMQDGDVIYLSEREQGVILKKDIDEIAKKKGVKVTVAKEINPNIAGITIERKDVTLDFNIEVELKNIINDMEMEIIKEIYNDWLYISKCNL